MTAAAKLRERMRASKAGWTADDVDRLYRGHGFVCREGGKHRVYKHAEHAQLRATVTRSPGPVALGYIEAALELLDKVDQLAQCG